MSCNWCSRNSPFPPLPPPSFYYPVNNLEKTWERLGSWRNPSRISSMIVVPCNVTLSQFEQILETRNVIQKFEIDRTTSFFYQYQYHKYVIIIVFVKLNLVPLWLNGKQTLITWRKNFFSFSDSLSIPKFRSNIYIHVTRTCC